MSEPRSVSEDQRAYALGNESAGVVPAYARPNGELEWPSPGLTKRELFAAMAMQGLMSNLADIRKLGFKDHEIEEFACMRADGLLQELAK